MSWDFEVAPPEVRLSVYEQNVTFNLGPMLRRAGFHPDVMSDQPVKRVAKVAQESLCLLYDHRPYFTSLGAINGWGTIEDAITLLVELIVACDQAPDDYILKVF